MLSPAVPATEISPFTYELLSGFESAAVGGVISAIKEIVPMLGSLRESYSFPALSVSTMAIVWFPSPRTPSSTVWLLPLTVKGVLSMIMEMEYIPERSSAPVTLNWLEPL